MYSCGWTRAIDAKVGARRGIARQHLKRLALERPFDRTQAVGPLGMALAHVVARGRRGAR